MAHLLANHTNGDLFQLNAATEETCSEKTNLYQPFNKNG